MTTLDTASRTERIATALGRLRAALDSRPELGRAKVATSVSDLTEGLRCVVREDTWQVESDLAPPLGGDGLAPSPSALVRAALGACLAMGYQLRAAEAGITIGAVRVTVESESDVRGLLGPASSQPPGFTALRYHVEVDSPASAEELNRLIELGDLHSPVLDMLTRPLPVARSVSFGPLTPVEV
jgi:uncharacterized OsmC-like protein